MTRSPSEYQQRRPFDYIHLSMKELEPFLGEKWVLARATKRMREKYPDHTFISQKTYNEAVRKAFDARGYARLAEKAIRDLLLIIEGDSTPKHYDLTITAAHEILAKARTP